MRPWWVIAGAAGLLGGAGLAAFVAGSPQPVPPAPPALVELTRGPDVARAQAPEGAPHVVLLIGCTVRQDQVGAYGGPPGVTPWIDALAARGTRVEDPIAASAWTRPSVVAMLTGQHALALGMVEPGNKPNQRPLPVDVPVLAEQFRRAGWTTVGGTANPNLHATYGLHRGFDVYAQPAELWRETTARVMADDMLPPLLEALDTRPDPERPVFLQLMLIDAHAPYDLEPEVLSAFADPSVPPSVGAYRAALNRMDQGFQAFEAALASRLDPARTVVVFVSDHGEGLEHPAHHGKSHGRYLVSSAVEAVWIAAGPGIPAGALTPGLASQIDVGPTVLGLAGIPVPPADPGGARDLSAALRASAPTGRELAFSDTWFATANRASVRSSTRACLRDYAVDEPPAPTGRMIPGCFDRAADPFEERPLDGDQPLLAVVDAWRQATSAGGRSATPVEVGSALDAQLQALGYVEVPE